MNLPVVNPVAAQQFAQSWTYKGQLFIALDPAYIQFAADFATAVLQGFIVEQLKKAQPPKIISTEI